jgi:hypothetical protein
LEEIPLPQPEQATSILLLQIEMAGHNTKARAGIAPEFRDITVGATCRRLSEDVKHIHNFHKIPRATTQKKWMFSTGLNPPERFNEIF